MDDRYALAQWRTALITAASTDSEVTRERARRRMGQWQRVIDGMRSGKIRPGSRTPVTGLPAWVTPEVVRGGFATGRPAAGGPLTAFECRIARAAGVPEERAAIFAYAISEPGVERLWRTLDAGRFEIDLPEAAALLVVAWLVRAGEPAAALELVRILRPFAPAIRFLPRTESADTNDPDVLWREDAGSVTRALRDKQHPEQIRRMVDVLDTWNPYADRLLEHWLPAVEDGRLTVPTDSAWSNTGRDLLAEFDRLSTDRTPPRRHTSPKENAAILRLALAGTLDGRELTARERGRVVGAVRSMVQRRGMPGSPELTALRKQQRAQAARPTVAAIARVVADRLADTHPDSGITEVTRFTGPVSDAEADTSGIPAGTPVPATVNRVLRRATAGTLPELLDGGVVTSAELLATLVPQLTAQVVAEQYQDPVLRVLVARSYEAFRRRRSLLLLDLEHQVTAEELPWVAAASAWRSETVANRDVAKETLLRLADTTIARWPGTLLPNALLSELEALATAAGLSEPFVQEIAADIFTGRFTAKYAAAFDRAASVLAGSRYWRYYGITADDAARVAGSRAPGAAFGRLCAERAAAPGHAWCVVCHGMVLEQSQILTTYNLATLLTIGLAPRGGWRPAAEGALAHAASLLGRLPGNRKPLRTVKDLAYAWRQTVFFLSMLDEAEQEDFLARAVEDANRRPPFVRDRLLGQLEGLRRPGKHPPLLGWAHGRHPILGGD